MLINQINKSGTGGGNVNTYAYVFQEQNWERNDNLYVLRIPTSLHSLSVNCFVVVVERLENNIYQSTMFSYERLTNGTIIINSSLPFNGRAILQED